MRKLISKSKIYVIAIIIMAFVFTLVLFFPAAGAETEDEGIEIKSSEAWILDTTSTGKIDKARMITWFDIKGEGTVDVTKENTLEENTKWQGVHGFTAPVVEGDYLVWKNVKVDGNANVLSSTQLGEDLVEDVEMRIPLDLHYEYWFDEDGDGKDVMLKVNPEDIVGKNGHFRMDLTMTNTSDEMTTVEYEDPDTGEVIEGETETYLPLVILPYDWYFPDDVFFDLEVDPTGLAVYVPNYYQLGWSIPLFPPATERSHTIWVEADVKNFEMPPLVLSANFIFPQTNQIDTMPLFVSGFAQLYDGVKQMNEGVSGTGAEGEETLLSGTSQILDGLKQMAAGLPEAVENIDNQMIPGVAEAAAGIGTPGTSDTMMYGLNAVSVGLLQMVAGIGGPDIGETMIFGLSSMGEGLEEMAAGFDEMLAGIGSPTEEDTILYGLKQMAAGIGSPKTGDTILYGLDQIGGGLLEMKTGIGVPGTPNTLQFAIAEMAAGLREMAAGIGDISQQDTLIGGLELMADGLNQMADGIGDELTPDTMLFGLSEISKGLSTGLVDDPGMKEGLREMYAGLSEMYVGTAPDGELRQALGLIRILAPWTGPLVDQLENGIIFGTPDSPSMHDGIGQMMDGMDEMMDGIGTPETPDTLLFGVDQISDGLVQMRDGIRSDMSSDTLLYGIAEMQSGLNEMKTGIGHADVPDTLLYAMDQVQMGLNEMLKGIGSSATPDTLLYGLVEIQKGLQEMKEGIEAEGSTNTLVYAMDSMADGLRQMKEGIGSAATADSLLFGLSQVQAGLEEMVAGIGAEGTSDTMLYGLAEIQHGLFQMREGLASGDMNDPGLKEGLIMLSAGLGEAVAGMGSEDTPDTLVYGVDQINAGVEELAGGLDMMQQGLMDNLGMLYLSEAQVEATKVRGEEFDHIMGRADDADNIVTFIYQTPPAYGYKNGSSWKIAGILSLLILLVLVLGGILLARRPVAG